MGKLKKQIWSIVKLIGPWAIIALLPIGKKLFDYCATMPSGFCDDLTEELISYSILIGTLAIILILLRRTYKWLFKSKEIPQNKSLLCEFALYPDRFNKSVVALYGLVEKVHRDSVTNTIKRKAINQIKNLTNSSSSNNGSIHQRFSITSPMLRQGKTISVHHNTTFGTINIKEGLWVKIRGEYVHPTHEEIEKNGHFYGIIHNTHEPIGFVSVLKTKPVWQDSKPPQVHVERIGAALKNADQKNADQKDSNTETIVAVESYD